MRMKKSKSKLIRRTKKVDREKREAIFFKIETGRTDPLLRLEKIQEGAPELAASADRRCRRHCSWPSCYVEWWCQGPPAPPPCFDAHGVTVSSFVALLYLRLRHQVVEAGFYAENNLLKICTASKSVWVLLVGPPLHSVECEMGSSFESAASQFSSTISLACS